jgi:hypothetical protein
MVPLKNSGFAVLVETDPLERGRIAALTAVTPGAETAGGKSAKHRTVI